jgi:hypothetical protein
MAALGAKGFWSYAHADDDSEGGRIRDLAGLIRREYRLLTGQELDLFLDRDAIEWGEHWRERIEVALAGVTFFIPIVTPTYFASEECRKELLKFERTARQLGVEDLLMPIIYVPVPGLEETSSDEAIAAVARAQWEDWTELRLSAFSSSKHRQGVNRLAVRLSEVGEAVARRPVAVPAAAKARAGETTPAGAGAGDAETEEPGVLEKLAEMEETYPALTETVAALAAVFEEVNAITDGAAEEMARPEVAQKGFAARLGVAHRLARSLSDPAESVLELGTQWASQLLAVDAGIRELIKMADAAETDEDRQAACELFATLRVTAATSQELVQQFQGLSETLETSAGFSRELRAPLKKMQDGLRRVLDGQGVVEEWAKEIDRSSLDCTGIDVSSVVPDASAEETA